MRRKRYKKPPIATQSAKQQQQLNPQSIDNLKLDTYNTTPANILHLQRTIGNTAVQRLLTAQNITPAPQNKPVIQRTGLRDEDAAGGFSSAVKAVYADPSNADLSIEAFLTQLTPIVVASLNTIGAPPLKIMPDSSGEDNSYASFQLKEWQILFTMSGAFKTGNHVRDLSESDIGNMVNSLYHEARHAEQQFRVAQMLAGQKMPQTGDITDEDRQKAKDFIFDEMKLKSRDNQPIDDKSHPMLELAVQNPIYDNPDGDNQAFEEAQGWYEEVFGKDKKYRTLMLTVKDKVMPDLSDWVEAAIKKLDEKATDISFEIGWIKFYLDRLMIYEEKLDEELARVKAISDSEQTANDVSMRYHLEQLKWDFEQVKSLRPVTVANLREMEASKISINKEVYAAYLDLPTETDAWGTGNLAQSEYNDTLPQFAE